MQVEREKVLINWRSGARKEINVYENGFYNSRDAGYLITTVRMRKREAEKKVFIPHNNMFYI